MPQIGPAEAVLAGMTIAVLLDPGVIFRISGISQPEDATSGKGTGISTVSRGEHTIEHVHPGPYRHHKILLISNPHEIQGLLYWKEWNGKFDRRADLIWAFPHRDPSYRKTGQVDVADCFD